jgi:hypothetical protein
VSSESGVRAWALCVGGLSRRISRKGKRCVSKREREREWRTETIGWTGKIRAKITTSAGG